MKVSEIKNEKLQSLIERFDITKLDNSFIEKVATIPFEKLDEETANKVVLSAILFGCGITGEEELTREEINKFTKTFIIEVILEYCVRQEFIEREGVWNIKNSGECHYRITEKGRGFLENLPKFRIED